MSLETLPEAALKELLLLTEAKKRLDLREKAQDSFMSFAHHVYENFIEGRHHRVIAEKLERVARGELKRLIINMPPRHSKSELASYLMPAWFLGRNPKLKIIQATHNTELAVRFGRKVRDLIADPHYGEIFPKTNLKEDSKSAGRWQTDQLGEYFACLTPDTPVNTPTGYVPAGDVRVGDRLLNASGEVIVEEIYHSTHDATVTVGGIKCSKNHPIWTMNRGWVEAGDLSPQDILCVESIYDTLQVSLKGCLHAVVEHPYVSPLVQHKIPLRKPQKREVSIVRRAGDYLVRAVEGLRKLLVGHGAPAVALAHHRSHRREWPLQPGKLSLGDPARAVKQQARQCSGSWADARGACSGAWYNARGFALSPQQGSLGGSSAGLGEKAQGPFEHYGPPENLGWARRWALWLLGRGWSGSQSIEPGDRAKERLARLHGGAQDVLGLLLGLRSAGDIRVENHGPRPFVNYRVSGDNTFFAAGILTHNCGVGAAMTGRGADLLIIDDPHSEQDALSPTAFEYAYEWYTSGPRQRLQPGGAIIIVQTRWGKRDLTGRILQAQGSDVMADQWEVVEFPAIMPSGEPLWPEFWEKDALLSVKASLPLAKWSAQWQQQPTVSDAGIIRKEWWRRWQQEDVPRLDYILQAYDTAFSKKESADYSAITTWGIFKPEIDGPDHIILLDAQRGRWSFPELKQVAFEEHEYWQPDMVLVEAKATGQPLIDELRLKNIPALGFSPGGRGGGRDKVSRMHMVAPLFEAGVVWAPEDKSFSEEVIEEVTSFPNGDHDDFCDSMTLALMRFRQGGFVALDGEEAADDPIPRKREYY